MGRSLKRLFWGINKISNNAAIMLFLLVFFDFESTRKGRKERRGKERKQSGTAMITLIDIANEVS